MTQIAPHAIYMCPRKSQTTGVLRTSGAWTREKINVSPDRPDDRPEGNRRLFTDERSSTDVRRGNQKAFYGCPDSTGQPTHRNLSVKDNGDDDKGRR